MVVCAIVRRQWFRGRPVVVYRPAHTHTHTHTHTCVQTCTHTHTHTHTLVYRPDVLRQLVLS